MYKSEKIFSINYYLLKSRFSPKFLTNIRELSFDKHFDARASMRVKLHFDELNIGVKKKSDLFSYLGILLVAEFVGFIELSSESDGSKFDKLLYQDLTRNSWFVKAGIEFLPMPMFALIFETKIINNYTNQTLAINGDLIDFYNENLEPSKFIRLGSIIKAEKVDPGILSYFMGDMEILKTLINDTGINLFLDFVKSKDLSYLLNDGFKHELAISMQNPLEIIDNQKNSWVSEFFAGMLSYFSCLEAVSENFQGNDVNDHYQALRWSLFSNWFNFNECYLKVSSIIDHLLAANQSLTNQIKNSSNIFHLSSEDLEELPFLSSKLASDERDYLHSLDGKLKYFTSDISTKFPALTNSTSA